VKLSAKRVQKSTSASVTESLASALWKFENPGVRRAPRVDAVGDDDRRPSGRRDVVDEKLRREAFAVFVDGGGRFVEKDRRRGMEESGGEPDPLASASRQR
jgi:hypothetical protein